MIHPYHLDDDSDAAHLFAHGVACPYRMGDFMDGAARKDTHLGRGQVEDSSVIECGEEEHGDGAENHYCSHGHGGLVGFGLDGAVYAHHRRGSANGAAAGCQQGDGAVHLEQLAQQDAQQDGARYDNAVNDDGGKPHSHHVLEAQAEAIEDDAQPQQALAREGYARHPSLRQLVAEAVGVCHAQYDANH